jgi:hypothetical protein
LILRLSSSPSSIGERIAFNSIFDEEYLHNMVPDLILEDLAVCGEPAAMAEGLTEVAEPLDLPPLVD